MQRTLKRAVRNYFNLERPVGAFDLQGSGVVEAKPISWLPQYLALFVGIVTQRFFQVYLDSGRWQLGGFWGWLFASVVIALLAFPAVYRRSFDPERPLPVQLCVIFAAGMGWQSLVKVSGVVAKAASN